MDYDYTTTGGLRVGSCAAYQLTHFFIYGFAVGSIVYSRAKANKGVYEKIFIKNIKPVSRYPVTGKNVVPETRFKAMYVDSLNGYWNEDELVSYEVATDLVDAYYVRAYAEAEQMALLCK